MTVKLPEYAEYSLDMYEAAEGGALSAVCTYQIIRHEPLPGEEVEEEPKEELSDEEKQRLKEERAQGDHILYMLHHAI